MMENCAIFKAKKMTFVIITVCILLLAFTSPLLGMAAKPADYTYRIDSGSAVITGYTGTKTHIDIPPILGGYYVESIESEALSNLGLYRAKIPASVTSIGENAFAGNEAGLIIVGEPGSAAEAYALENDHQFRSKGWTVEKTADHDAVTLNPGESATILYTIVSTHHADSFNTFTYDNFLIWDGVEYYWGDALVNEGQVTMSIAGFEIQRPSSSLSLSSGRESRTDSYQLTITNVNAEAGKTFSLGNYAFVFYEGPIDWTANLIAVTTPGGEVPEETPDPDEEIVEEEEAVDDDEGEEEAVDDDDDDDELPQTGVPANYGLGLLLLAGGALTLMKNRR